MAAALHIRRLRTRYRLSSRTRGAVARLDRIQRAVLDDALTAALDRLGIDGRREICVRRVGSQVAVSLGARDDEIAQVWARSMAVRIRAAIDAGSADVVRYQNRHEALLDAAASLAAGDDTRAWAWQQLGLFGGVRASGAAAPGEALLAVLLAAAPVAPAILSALVRSGLTARLRAIVSPTGWSALARAALVANGLPTGALDGAIPLTPLSPSARARAQRLAGRSSLTALIAPPAMRPANASVTTAPRDTGARPLEGPGGRGLDEPTAALAALALLEVEPVAFAGAAGEVAALLAAFAAGAVTDAVTGPPLAAAEESRPRAPGSTPAPARRGSGDAPAAAWQAPADARQAPAPTTRASSLARTASRTEHGGLPFLLHLVRDAGVPTTFAAWLDGAGPPLAPGRTFRGLMHGLARTLVALPVDDPAALAFAGLPPDAPPPTRDEPAPTAGEEAALAELAAALVVELRRRLDRLTEPAPSLLAWLCRRRATVVADPGWLDVELSLDDVDTSVRRSGLDLDLGWLPWLGVAVRFLYA